MGQGRSQGDAADDLPFGRLALETATKGASLGDRECDSRTAPSFPVWLVAFAIGYCAQAPDRTVKIELAGLCAADHCVEVRRG